MRTISRFEPAEGTTMQRFRWMSLYALFVTLVLAYAIAAIALGRSAPG